MTSYEGFGKDFCNLPDYCECSQCNYWGEHGWDVSRTPSWQMPKDEEDE